MEKKKGTVIAIVGVIIFFIIISGLSVNGYFLDKKQFKDHINGIVLSKKDGSKGSYTLLIGNSFDSTHHVFNGMQLFDIIRNGDSIDKTKNSYFLSLYRKNQFIDSFKIGPTGLAFLLE